MQQDIRWRQRYENYRKALTTVTEATELARTRPLTQLERQGVIQGFEFTHELAWKLLKDYLEEQGFSGLVGSRNAVRVAFQNGLLEHGEAWMQMIDDRNLSSHTYNTDVAEKLVERIFGEYYPAFLLLSQRFNQYLNKP